MDIVVLTGGLSSEREVSFQTGALAAKALRENGHRVILLDAFMGYREAEEDISDIFDHSGEIRMEVSGISESVPDLEKVRASRKGSPDCYFGPNVIRMCQMADIVFMAIHGDGENGRIQAAFDLFGIRYTGAGHLSSAIAMDKGISKALFQAEGVPVPKGRLLKKSGRPASLADTGQELPCVVKPCSGGSSVGVSIVRREEEFAAALDAAFAWEDQVIVEDYIQGREFSVGVLEGRALPVIEIAPVEGFYDYKNKYKAGSAVETCPADLPPEDAGRMQRYAEAAARALGIGLFSRMDFLMNDRGEMFCLEANTLPGMTDTSLLPQEARAIGIDYNQLCEKLIRISLKKYS